MGQTNYLDLAENMLSALREQEKKMASLEHSVTEQKGFNEKVAARLERLEGLSNLASSKISDLEEKLVTPKIKADPDKKTTTIPQQQQKTGRKSDFSRMPDDHERYVKVITYPYEVLTPEMLVSLMLRG